MSMSLTWNKCQGEVWCKLSTVNLNHEHFNNMAGVYVIWHAGPTPRTVNVGQGRIRDQLTIQRQNREIQAYDNLGLYVTWASVPQPNRDGVERYIVDRLQPIVRTSQPTAPPTEVTLPW